MRWCQAPLNVSLLPAKQRGAGCLPCSAFTVDDRYLKDHWAELLGISEWYRAYRNQHLRPATAGAPGSRERDWLDNLSRPGTTPGLQPEL